MHILIIDDNEEIILGLEKLLKDAKFYIQTASTLHDAQKRVNEQSYDLIILDWMLPDGSGIDFLKYQRNLNLKTPVMMLSSKSDVLEKAEALDSGADDYLQKPFSHIELLARIRALLRRDGNQKKSAISIANLSVNFITREVLVDNRVIELSKKEFELLELLLLNSNIALTRYQIESHLNRDFDSLKTSNIVDAHVKNLRKKLGSASGLIETVRGVGFTIKLT
jgi:DNA-binding response OmpR family regulator